MALFRKKNEPSWPETPEIQAAKERMIQTMRAARDPQAPIPGVSSEASRIVRDAIGRIGKEYGQQYRMMTGNDFEYGTFHAVHFSGLTELAKVVDLLIDAPEEDIFDIPPERVMLIYGTAPGWEMIAGPSGWPDLDMLFRIAALSLHNADANESRRSNNVWFDAASAELGKLEKKAQGTL